MIDKPWHCNPLHPCADKRYALSTEKKPVIPVLKRPEYYFESVSILPGPGLIHKFFSINVTTCHGMSLQFPNKFIEYLYYFFTGAISRILNESGFGVRLGLGLSAVASGAVLNSAVGI